MTRLNTSLPEPVRPEPELRRRSLARSRDRRQGIVGRAQRREDRQQHPASEDADPRDEAGRERAARDPHAGVASRMRGSSKAASRSTSRFTRT